jgi:hypothetical protein
MNMPEWLRSLAESECDACVEDVEFGETRFGIRWAKPSADSYRAWVLEVNPEGLDPTVVDLLSLSQALEEVSSWRFDEGGHRHSRRTSSCGGRSADTRSKSGCGWQPMRRVRPTPSWR